MEAEPFFFNHLFFTQVVTNIAEAHQNHKYNKPVEKIHILGKIWRGIICIFMDIQLVLQ